MLEKIKAVILAGGMGLRIREVVKDILKPMVPIAGKPFLEYLILQLKRWNIKDIILSIGYKGDTIKTFFENGNKWGVNIVYSAEQEPLGTGGALRETGKLIKDDYFVVMNGDSFLDIDFDLFIDFHIKKRAFATMGLVDVNNAERYGRVTIDDDGEVVGFMEKGSNGQGTINGGIYIVDRKILDYIPPGKVSLETDVLPCLIGKGLFGLITNGFFVDIGVPEDYFKLSNDYARLIKCTKGDKGE